MACNASVGPILTLRREKLGLSQEDFAERAHVHRTYIRSIELGKVNMGIEIVNALASALRMKLCELVRKAASWGQAIDFIAADEEYRDPDLAPER